jgi:hypothetical protein
MIKQTDPIKKHCFKACWEEKVKSGLCDCVNRLKLKNDQIAHITQGKHDAHITIESDSNGFGSWLLPAKLKISHLDVVQLEGDHYAPFLLRLGRNTEITEGQVNLIPSFSDLLNQFTTTGTLPLHDTVLDETDYISLKGDPVSKFRFVLWLTEINDIPMDKPKPFVSFDQNEEESHVSMERVEFGRNISIEIPMESYLKHFKGNRITYLEFLPLLKDHGINKNTIDFNRFPQEMREELLHDFFSFNIGKKVSISVLWGSLNSICSNAVFIVGGDIYRDRITPFEIIENGYCHKHFNYSDIYYAQVIESPEHLTTMKPLENGKV